jgi:hypothetical protein
VSNRQLLVVRALTLHEVTGEIGAKMVTAEDLPSPLQGFQLVGSPSALSAFRGADCVWLAAFAHSEMRALGQSIARGAMIGPLRSPSAPTDREDSFELAYRAFFDHVMSASPSPNVISVRLGGEEEARTDALWRIALAMDGRVVIRGERGGVRVDIFRTGRRAALALALSSGWRDSAAGLTLRNLARLRGVQRKARQVLLVLARDARDPIARVELRVAVEYDEATDAEVQRHPLRFGLRLNANGADPTVRRHFVGRLNGEVVFRMTLNFSAPLLDRLILPSIGNSHVAPVALVTHCATDPRFRGQSIYSGGLQWLARWSAERGVRTLVLLVEPNNIASLTGAGRAGFKRVGEIATQR